MSADLSYGPPDGPRDESLFSEAQSRAFAFPTEDIPKWWEQFGVENLRVLRDRGSVVGGLAAIPMGQFFGGRSLATAGIVGVAIRPEHRGRGLGKRLMAETLRELRGRGFPISTLYPSTYPLYRSAGYEFAGGLYVVKGPAHNLPKGSRDLLIRPEERSDEPKVEKLYRAMAQNSQGYFDRDPYLWQRTRHPQFKSTDRYVIDADGNIEGFVYFLRSRRPDGFHDIRLTAWGVRSARATRSLMTFLADQFSMGGEISWYAAPNDPTVFQLQDRGFEITVMERWMIRLVDLPKALEQRGYPQGFRATLDLDVTDPLLPENEGGIRLEVGDGQAQVLPRREARGGIAIDIAPLAALYSGHATAHGLSLAGQLQASNGDLSLIDDVFRSSTPAATDMF